MSAIQGAGLEGFHCIRFMEKFKYENTKVISVNFFVDNISNY